jgi:hypothetical protein
LHSPEFLHRTRFLGAVFLALALPLGCDDPPKRTNPFDPPPDKPKQPPRLTEPPKPTGPPHLTIDTLGPKVGFNRALLDKPEGRAQLSQEVAAVRQHFEGKEAPVIVDRKAKISWVIAMIDELGKVGVTAVKVKTETRKEFPAEITFLPPAKASSAPCSPVAMVLEDRGTAVWKLSGGTAMKRARGFAGPDLSMTQETIERIGKGCSGASAIFVSGAEAIEWGLVYDLAGSAKTLAAPKFDSVVLLPETPVPGHKVDVSS